MIKQVFDLIFLNRYIIAQFLKILELFKVLCQKIANSYILHKEMIFEKRKRKIPNHLSIQTP